MSQVPSAVSHGGRWRRSIFVVAIGATLLAPIARALTIPRAPADPNLAALQTKDPRLFISPQTETVDQGRAEMNPHAVAAWDSFRGQGHGPWQAQVNRLNGLVEIAEGKGIPWVPGHGNDLSLRDVAGYLGARSTPDLKSLEAIARDMLPQVEDLLGTAQRVLVLDPQASGNPSDYLWNVIFDVYTIDGLKIDGANVFFRVNNGNLIQFGADGLPPADEDLPVPVLGRDQALQALSTYVGGLRGDDLFWDAGTELAMRMNTTAHGGGNGKPKSVKAPMGRGMTLEPVWRFGFIRHGHSVAWQATVDAVTGEVLAFEDSDKYAQITGGVWPISWRVGGVKQSQVDVGFPFAKLTPSGIFTGSSGLYTYPGSAQTASHKGNQYATIASDTCGASSITTDASGNADWGTIPTASTPGDCTTPGIGGAGNDASARQQYYMVTRMMEKARSYLPSNTWLQGQIPINVNLTQTCNAYWNGSSLNFFKSGGGCANTGEDSAVSLHEWGHGLDTNDGNGDSLDNGTGETYGDFNAVNFLHDSCVGWGFDLAGGGCGGYGNACTQHPAGGKCDGVRDIEWNNHANNTPWTVGSFTQTLCPCSINRFTGQCSGTYVGPCGKDFIARGGGTSPNRKEGHCESYVSSGALWDFARWDLTQGCSTRGGAVTNSFPDYGCAPNNTGSGGPYDSNTAWQIMDRLWFVSRGSATQAFTCNTSGATWTSDGCNAGSNWKAIRAADDDDGNLANGTPHSCELAAAFNRAGIACTTDAGWNTCFRGCTQPAAPTLSVNSSSPTQIQIGWAPNPGAQVIDVFRNQLGCSFGFTRIANDTSGTSYTDNSVLPGTTYYYQVQQQPSGNEACGSPVSNCVVATACTVPAAPTGLTATANAANNIALAWSGSASSYKILRATTPGGPYTQVGTSATTSFDDGTVVAGTTYYYVVRAVSSCDSNDSNEASATAWGDCTATPTFAGVRSVALLGNGQGCGLRVSWNAGTANCTAGALSYNVYRSTTSGFTPGSANRIATCVGGTSYDDTTATVGTAYFYVVRAEDSKGSGSGPCGGGVEDGNTTQKSGTVTSGAATLTLYSNDFSVSASDWTSVSFVAGSPDSWQGIQSCSGSVLRFGGATCTGTYSASNFIGKQPGAIAVPAGATNTRLTFSHRWQFEKSGSRYFDGGTVAISLDGANYTLVPAAAITGGPSFSGSISNSCPPAGASGIPVWGGQSTNFTTNVMQASTINLDAACNAATGGTGGCAGQSVYLAWIAITDCSTNQQGWFIDNVQVTADVTSPVCSAAPSPVGYLTSTGKDSQVTVQAADPVGSYSATRICHSSGAYPADPGNTACPLGPDRQDATFTSGGASTAVFSGPTAPNGSTQYFSAFVNNGGVYSGRQTVSGYPFSVGTVRWNFVTGAAALSPPLQSSGVGLFAGSNDRAVHAMTIGDPTTNVNVGLWPSGWVPAGMNGPAQEQPLVLPTAYTGFAFPAVFVGSQDGFVYCFRADTGAGCGGWAAGGRSASLGSGVTLQATPMIDYDAVAANRLLIVGTRISGGTNKLFALRIADGSIAWSFDNSVGQGGDGKAIGIVSAPAFVDAANHAAYFTSRASTAVGGSTNTVWKVSFTTGVGGAPTLAWGHALGDVDGAFTQDWNANRMLVGTNGGAVLALDPSNGNTVWSRSFGDGPVKDFVYYDQKSPAGTGVPRLYFATTSKVWSILASGATGSDWTVSAISPSRPLLHAGTNRTYIGACANVACSDGRVIEVDSANAWGTPKTYDLAGAGGLGAIVIDRTPSQAMLYAGSRSGRIYAILDPLP